MIDPGCDCSHCLDAIGAATRKYVDLYDPATDDEDLDSSGALGWVSTG